MQLRSATDWSSSEYKGVTVVVEALIYGFRATRNACGGNVGVFLLWYACDIQCVCVCVCVCAIFDEWCVFFHFVHHSLKVLNS